MLFVLVTFSSSLGDSLERGPIIVHRRFIHHLWTHDLDVAQIYTLREADHDLHPSLSRGGMSLRYRRN